MPTRRELILSTTVTVLGASALGASATKILTNKKTASRGCLSCGPVQGSSVDGDPDQESCESLIVDAGEEIELVPSGGEQTETEEWIPLFGVINVAQDGIIHYTAPAYRPPYGMDYFYRVDDLGQTTHLRLKIVNGVTPADFISTTDQDGQEIPIDLSDPEWIDEPCPAVSLLPSIAVSDIPILNVIEEGSVEVIASETLELFQLPDTGAITLFLQQKQKPGKPPKPKPKKCHPNCQKLPIPTECNGNSWSIPGKWNTVRTGGHDWTDKNAKGKVNTTSKAIIKKYLGINLELGIDYDFPYQLKVIKKKMFQYTDNYRCVNGKPEFISTTICTRMGEVEWFRATWIALLLGKQDNVELWTPEKGMSPDCYDSHQV
jgi:hypothetical protein